MNASNYEKGLRSPVHLLGFVAAISLCIQVGPSVYAVDQACCDLSSTDRACFDDTIGSGLTCPGGQGLGAGTTCADDCPCASTCGTCVGKQAGNLSNVEVQFLGPPVFNGVNTTYTYRVCQISGHALSHWVLGLSETCCSRIIGATGPGAAGCGTDPTTGLYGFKWETGSGVSACIGPCGNSGTLFTITLSGNAASTGCVKIANKANGAEDTSTACLVGPTDDCTGVCVNHGQCDDGIPCTTDLCSPGSPGADSFGCLYTPDNSLCNDSEVCTDDECVPGVGCVFTPDDSNVCKDGEFCDGNESCVGGDCLSGPPPCNDNVACTIDTCDENTDQCIYTPNHASCSNGQFCDGVEVCHPTKGCQPGTPVNCSHLNGLCVVGVCDEDADACVPVPVADNTPCNDGQFCTTGDVCVAGNCQGAPRDCDDGVGCTNDLCDEVGDVCIHNENDSKCDDGLFCNGFEVCEPSDSGANPLTGCVPGDTACSNCICNEDVDVCVCGCPGIPCPEPAECQVVECDDGDCLYSPAGQGTPCTDDGIACTTDVCDGSGTCIHLPDDGACTPDANECTDTVCHPTLGCIHVNDDTNGCDDGLFCTINDQCVGGECVGDPLVCDDGIDCTDDSCDENLDACLHTPDNGDCPMSNSPCFSFICDPMQGCIIVNHDGVPCDDGLFCTVDDVCGGGQCDGAPRNCDDSIACTTQVCDDVADACVYHPKDTLCDDMIACTVDVCLVGQGCVHTPDDSICQDNFFCNGTESCDPQQGCISSGNPCSEPLPLCCEEADQCVEECCVNAHCDDGNACNTDICNLDGVCEHTDGVSCPGPTETCDGGTECNPDTGACDSLPDPPSGSTCEADADLCTTHLCDGAGNCVLSQTVECPPPSGPCDGGLACNPATGACENLPDLPLGTVCEADQDLCTMHACDGQGNCVLTGSAMVTCPPPTGPCDGGSACDPATGLCVPLPDPVGTPCETDKNECTVQECDGTGQCVAVQDLCPDGQIPTVSEWGLVVLALLLLIGSKIYFGRRMFEPVT